MAVDRTIFPWNKFYGSQCIVIATGSGTATSIGIIICTIVRWPEFLSTIKETKLYKAFCLHPSCAYSCYEAAVSLVEHLSSVLTATESIVTLHPKRQVLNDATNVARLIPGIIEA